MRQEIFLPSFTQKWVLHLIFIRIPKNASTSMYEHLGGYNLIHKYRQNFIDANLRNPTYRGFFDPTHAKPSEITKILPLNVSNYLSFAIVRNPWDRFVSMYSFSKKLQLWKMFGLDAPPSFEEFCEISKEKWLNNEDHFFPSQPQTLWLGGSFKTERILRFESLKGDFKKMLLDYNIEHISPDLPHSNSSQHDHYKVYYNENTKSIVQSIFESDIDQFKYTFK